MTKDLLTLKRTHFVLWRLQNPNPAPKLVIGQFQAGNPPRFVKEDRFTLKRNGEHTDLWEVAASHCHLSENVVYHYWFEVNDVTPGRTTGTRIQITDPTAT